MIISPEVEVGELILQRMAYPGASDIVSFDDDQVLVLSVPVAEDCAIIDTPLHQLTELFPNLQAMVMGVIRDGEMIALKSNDFMMAGDEAIVSVAKDQSIACFPCSAEKKSFLTRL